MLEKLKRIDWAIVILLIIFMSVGTLLIHSATFNNLSYTGTDIKNLRNYALGFLVMFGILCIDYRFLLRISIYIYAVGIILLLAVYKYGIVIHKAKSWFSLPFGFDFQPAELMKLILIIAIAYFMARRNGEPLELAKDVLPIGLITGIPFLLVLFQPDLGNAIIYLIILLGMFWIGNIKYTHVLIGIVVIVSILVLCLHLFQTYHQPIQQYLVAHSKGHWVDRMDTFLDPQNASADDIYQVKKSKMAIGSGGLTGEGYLRGNSVQKHFIPYAYSDSIFVVIAEENGFVGASLLLLCYFLLIYRMILISIQTVNLSGSFIIIGIVSMFVFQIFENVGMLLGIVPLTGITLPFISYGGTSLFINMICIGLVMSIRIHQEDPQEY